MPKINYPEINIQWVDSIAGDFSFTKSWSYPEGVIENSMSEPRFDGTYKSRIDGMKDKDGNIKPDSLSVYYTLFDTTHYFHTLKSEAWCYEYAGTNYITCFKNDAGYINCFSVNNVSTHSSLKLSIKDNICIPYVHYTSVSSKTGLKIFKCTSGTILIHSNMLLKGFLIAEFDFKFYNSLDPSKPIYWKGRIYSPVIEM